MTATTIEPDGARCVSVVMPCFNEVTTVKYVLDRVLASPYTAEVVVVDDGSVDGTTGVLRGIGDARVKIVEQQINLGRGAALRRGFAEATAPFVIVQDADLEYDPEDWPAVLRPLIDDEADVVFGSRFTEEPHRVLYYWHAVANKALTLASNAVTGLNLSDVATGSKAFRREVIQSLDLEQDRFGFEQEVTAKVAARQLRVFEVGISYNGRTYEEGKGTRWFDAVRWLYCIARYSRLGTRLARPRDIHESSGLTTFEEADGDLSTTLDNLDDAGNYADWIVDLIAPHVGGEIIEIGAGHGTMAERLRKLGRVTASEPSTRAAAIMRDRFADAPDVTVTEAMAHEAMAGMHFDAAVMINVLEHIDDDQAILHDICSGLRPGGTLAVFVPAHEALYSNFDYRIGHRRRYRRANLAQKLSRAGFELVEVRYVNQPGAVAWLLTARLLRQEPTKATFATLFDRVMVPVLRVIEGRWPSHFGLSLLAIARRPLETD